MKIPVAVAAGIFLFVDGYKESNRAPAPTFPHFYRPITHNLLYNGNTPYGRNA